MSWLMLVCLGAAAAIAPAVDGRVHFGRKGLHSLQLQGTVVVRSGLHLVQFRCRALEVRLHEKLLRHTQCMRHTNCGCTLHGLYFV